MVDLTNDLDLGVVVGANQGESALYSRVIQVTANSADSGDPLQYADYAEMDGTISSTNPYVGLAKTGNGRPLSDRLEHLHGRHLDRGRHAEDLRRQQPRRRSHRGLRAERRPDVSGRGCPDTGRGADQWRRHAGFL